MMTRNQESFTTESFASWYMEYNYGIRCPIRKGKHSLPAAAAPAHIV